MSTPSSQSLPEGVPRTSEGDFSEYEASELKKIWEELKVCA
jgi:hypothetical protein